MGFLPFLNKIVVGAVFFARSVLNASAEMPPHGKPGNLKTLPGASIGVAASLNSSYNHQHAYLEAKFTHGFLIFANGTRGNGEKPDVAVNGDLSVSSSGQSFGFYYQLRPFKGYHLTMALRQSDTETQDSEIAVSGASRVRFTEEKRAYEISVIAEGQNWATGAWQPYVGFGVRQTELRENLSTDGGRRIGSKNVNQQSGQFTAGVSYQYKKLSGFVEGTASTLSDSRWALHTGVRFGFFHRPDSGS